MSDHPALVRAAAFCETFNLRVPILMAPMAGACPASLAIAVANAGGLGGCGALLMQPDAIKAWASDVRAGSNGGFQLNLWIPDPPPKRDVLPRMRSGDFLRNWGRRSRARPATSRRRTLPRNARPCWRQDQPIISSIMGLYPDHFVRADEGNGIKWFATATTVSEAKAAEDAGADVIIAQGMEAGGHRGAFDATKAEARHGRPFQSAARRCGCGESPRGCDGRNCRWARGCRGSSAGRFRSASRHRVPALP